MEQPESLCFWASLRAYKAGEISETAKLQHDLAHVFAGTRHPDEIQINASQVEEWSERDIVSAAVLNCMVQGLQAPSGAQELVINLILQSATSCLDELRKMDREREPILRIPVLYQLIMAAALKNGNRALIREMVSAATPAPGHDLLFGAQRQRSDLLWPGRLGTFGGEDGYGHEALDGQADNGCDLWADMIEAGWAVPRPHMQIWAATSGLPGPGIRLLDILTQHKIEIEDKAALIALQHEKFDILAHVLKLHAPEDEFTRQNMLCVAAVRGVKWLELLFQHGVDDLNWRPGPEHGPVSTPTRKEDGVPHRTPLHVAALCGNAEVVEWLIRHGAEAAHDYYGEDPYDVAKREGHEDALAVFDRFPECRAARPGDSFDRFPECRAARPGDSCGVL